MSKLFLLVLIITSLFFSACKKTDNFSPASISDYNLQTPGKYIIYRLDSLLYVNFGTIDTVVSYFAKDSVDGPVSDSLGRPGFRIFRFLRKNETDPWVPDNTFLTVPTRNRIELIENNLRYIKLQAPISNGFSWKGNAYLDTYDINIGTTNVMDFNLTYLDDWDYMYANLYQPLILGSLPLDSTITVNERDDVIGDTADVNSYSERNYSIEKYAKGIGLVYRNFYHIIWQPPTNTNNGYFTSDSYGITLTILNHN